MSVVWLMACGDFGPGAVRAGDEPVGASADALSAAESGLYLPSPSTLPMDGLGNVKVLEGTGARETIEFYPSAHRAIEGLDTERVADLLRERLPLAGYFRAGVRVLFDRDGAPESLVVHLARRDVYRFDTVKIVLGANLRVLSVRWDDAEVEEKDADVSAGWADKCPDNTVDIVYASPVPDYPTAKEGVLTAASQAQKLGMKVVRLLGKKASVASYRNWLACTHLKALGNIGHGNTSGIMLSDGTLSYSYFKGLGRNALQPKVIYLNSCQVHNDPLESAVLGAGTGKFIGGNINLLVGPSEKVFKCFWKKAIETRGEMEPIVKQCERDEKYPDKDAHGISGPGPLPWD